MQNNNPTTNRPSSPNQMKPRLQDLPYNGPSQRFSLTPQSVGLELQQMQMRQQQQQPEVSRITNSQMNPPILQHAHQLQQSQNEFEAYTKKQMGELQGGFQNMARPPKTVKIESSSDIRNSEATYKPSFMERRASATKQSEVPTNSGASCSLNSAPLTNTLQSALKPIQQLIAKNVASPSTPTNEAPVCMNPSHDPTMFQELPTEYFEQQLQKFRSGSHFFTGGAAEINGQLNEIFVKRLKDIDTNGYGDSNLKLVTYQEWVEILLKINESILCNVEELETEVVKRLEYVQSRANVSCRNSQGNEVMKCRKDIDSLLQYIQNAYHNNVWDMSGLTFETITPAQILGLNDKRLSDCSVVTGGSGGSLCSGGSQMGNSTDPEAMKNKLLCNMKALALEVAEKHDEVRELKRQVVCLEDDIQKAQKKIQFKDDVIRELRNDLKRNVKFASPQTVDGSLVMPPINLESDTQCNNATNLVQLGVQTMLSEDYSFQLESLSQTERMEEQQLSILSEELKQLFEISHECSKQKADKHRELLSQIFQKFESEKIAAYRKLDFIRRQLIDLENSALSTSSADASTTINDGDSGFSSKNENDQDSKILEALRKRLRCLNETTCDLKSRVQKLERENNELTTNLKASETISQRNDKILKEVAELICNVTDNPLSDIYKNSPQCNVNPLCEAITDMKQQFQEKENQLIQAIGHKNQKIEELMQSLITKEKVFNEHHRSCVNISEGEDIDNITPPASLAMQPHQMTLSPLSQHQGLHLTTHDRMLDALCDDLEKLQNP